MSFRWNQREHSEGSFLMHGNELVATSIGITANRTMLSCVMNVDAKEYKYYKSQGEILQAIANVYNRVKQWAFREIQKHTHYHRDFTNTVFLPEALNHGNYGALSQFLGKLRTNRVGSYVKLNLQESKGYFQKAATLLKPAAKLVKQRVQFGFVRLKKNMLYERSIEERRMILEELSNRGSDFTTPKREGNLINLTYALIKFNSNSPHFTRKQSLSTSKHSSKSLRKEGRSKQIYIDQLLSQTHVKEYLFKNTQLQRQNRRVKKVQKA